MVGLMWSWVLGAGAFVFLSLVACALENRWAERGGRKPDFNDYGEN